MRIWRRTPYTTSAFVPATLALLLSQLIGCASNPASGRSDRYVDWPVYLGDSDSRQYAGLRQIHRGNVSELQLAWTYRSGDADPDHRSQIQCNPIIIEGVLYGTTPSLKLFALDATTGKERWRFDPFEGENAVFGFGVNRGVAYWSDEEDRRILFAAGTNLYAVNAADGTLVEAFGQSGAVDLRVGLGERASDLFVASTTPGIVYQDLLILGHRASESLPSVPGDVRAFNIRSGELVWSFHTIPHPGEFGHETWPADAWKYAGGANAWAGMSLDEERGMVFIPTGSAADDFYGADRHGENLFANTILALDAATGQRIWHYQTVRHDVWDRDLPAPPNLVTILRQGKGLDAVAQVTKSGHVFVFDRETGEPLFPIDDVAARRSDLTGESTWPTQPIPSKPPPFARQRLRAQNITRLSPEKTARALERLERLRPSAPFMPPSEAGTVVFPGFDGGGEWGGAAADPTTGVLYVNASEMPWVLTMVELPDTESRSLSDLGRVVYATHCLYCHGVEREGGPLGVYPALTSLDASWEGEAFSTLLKRGQGRMPSFPFLEPAEVRQLKAYLFDWDEPIPPELTPSSADRGFGSEGPREVRYTSTGYHRFVDDEGYPVVEPPWGTLTAVDLNLGTIRWQVPLGEVEALREQGIPTTGVENYGGPLVTSGGLVFIAATKDERFRAFDKDTGELLWEVDLPAGGYATPAAYAVDGRQFVVIAVGGGKMGTPSYDAYLAFALP